MSEQQHTQGAAGEPIQPSSPYGQTSAGAPNAAHNPYSSASPSDAGTPQTSAGAPAANPYGSVDATPASATPATPYGQTSAGAPANPYGQTSAGAPAAQPAAPQAQSASPYGAPAGQPYGGAPVGQPGQPYGAPAGQPDQPYGAQAGQPYGAGAYGAPAGAAAPQPGMVPGGYPPETDKQMAMFAHLGNIVSFIVPLIIWLVGKEKGRLTNSEGKEALNFGIMLAISYTVAVVLGTVLSFVGIGFLIYLLMPLIGVFGLIYAIIAGMHVNNTGTPYRYPINMRLIS